LLPVAVWPGAFLSFLIFHQLPGSEVVAEDSLLFIRIEKMLGIFERVHNQPGPSESSYIIAAHITSSFYPCKLISYQLKGSYSELSKTWQSS